MAYDPFSESTLYDEHGKAVTTTVRVIGVGVTMTIGDSMNAAGLIPLTITFSEAIDPLTQFQLEYDASNPSKDNLNLSGDGDSDEPYLFTFGAGLMTIYNADGTHTLNEKDLGAGGNFVNSNTTYTFNQVFSGEASTTWQLWIEPVRGSVNVSALDITLKLPTGIVLPGGTSAPVANSAALKVTVGPGDASSDSTVVNPVCFAAGTRVLLADGSFKAVNEVKPDETVLAVPENDPIAEARPCRVLEVFHNAPSRLFQVTIKGTSIRATHRHPFYVKDKGWTPVEMLRAGDRVRTPAGGWIAIDGVRDTGESEPVFNLSVQGARTYFVKSVDEGPAVLVHNDSGGVKEVLETPVMLTGALAFWVWNYLKGAAPVALSVVKDPIPVITDAMGVGADVLSSSDAFNHSLYDRVHGVRDAASIRAKALIHAVPIIGRRIVPGAELGEGYDDDNYFAFDPEDRADAKATGGTIIDIDAFLISSVSGAKTFGTLLKVGAPGCVVTGVVVNGGTVTNIIVNGRKVALSVQSLAAAGIPTNVAINFLKQAAAAKPINSTRPQHGTDTHDWDSFAQAKAWEGDSQTEPGTARFNQNLVDLSGNEVPGFRPDAQRIRIDANGKKMIDVLEVQSPSQTRQFMVDKIAAIKKALGAQAGVIDWIPLNLP